MTHTCRWVGLVALCTLVSASAQPSEPPARERVVQSSSHSTEDAGRELANCTGGGEGQRLGTEQNLSRVAKASCFNAEQARAAEQFVNDRLNFWRRHLNLEEWRISIIMTRRDALKSKTVGGIRWDKGKKSAVISVLAASEYRLPFVEMLDDMEFTVVHELVHLELASLPRSEASRRSEEHAVNRLTDALLKLNRAK